MKTNATFGSRLITKRRLTAKQFLKERQEGNVSRAQFVPPSIGSSGFGHFETSLARPRYEVILD